MNKTPKQWFGLLAKLSIVAVVTLFVGLRSLSFFEFVFPADEWYLAYLGFGLTSGAVIAYLIVLKTDAKTSLQKTIAVAMMVISALGEVLTAGYGMQVEGWAKLGYTLTQDEFAFMILAVQVLALFHALAALLYFAGDDIARLFQDDDGDGIPNVVDRDWRPQRRPEPRPMAFDVEANPTVGRDQDR